MNFNNVLFVLCITALTSFPVPPVERTVPAVNASSPQLNANDAKGEMRSLWFLLPLQFDHNYDYVSLKNYFRRQCVKRKKVCSYLTHYH